MRTDAKSAATAPTAAEIYDERFVPALFGPWGRVIAELAGVAPGDRVLDVGCGTGALALAAERRAEAAGSVTGLDLSEEMLEVARRKPSRVEWRPGRAEELPFLEASFDHVVSQFALMFFADPVAALREMHRVLRPKGRLTVAVCDAVDHSPGYAVLVELLHRLFGQSVADAFRAPFALGDRHRLAELARDAGLGEAAIGRREGEVRFDSISALVATERACAWTLGGLLDEEQFRRLHDEAEESLAPFVAGDGDVVFGMPALVIEAARS